MIFFRQDINFFLQEIMVLMRDADATRAAIASAVDRLMLAAKHEPMRASWYILHFF